MSNATPASPEKKSPRPVLEVLAELHAAEDSHVMIQELINRIAKHRDRAFQKINALKAELRESLTSTDF